MTIIDNITSKTTDMLPIIGPQIITITITKKFTVRCPKPVQKPLHDGTFDAYILTTYNWFKQYL